MPHLPHAAPAEIGLDATRLQRAYDLLDEWTSGSEPAIPGGAILVGRGGKIVAPRYFGRQGPEADAEPIHVDGIFLLASITKPVVYLGAMLLVERGLLNLSDLVTRYLPDFAAHHKDQTLVQHLFTHTSGLPDMLDHNLALRQRHASLAEFTRGAIRDTVPLFPTGTNFSYQSMGTLCVAEIVQRITGLSIHNFLQREIFDPLQLRSTALGSRGLDEARLVRVQTPAYQGPSDSEFGWNSRYWRELGAPWGGMFSTPEDFAVICQVLLNRGTIGGVRLLAPHTVDRITENRLDDLPDLPEPIRRTNPWGLGWKLNSTGTSSSWSDLLSRRVFGHTGATGTMVWIDRERDGFCLLFTTAERARAPWRLVSLSNAVAASFM